MLTPLPAEDWDDQAREALASTVPPERRRPDKVGNALATLVRHSCARLGFTRAVVLVRSGPVWDGVRDDGTVEVHLHVSDQSAPLVDEEALV